ncbi:plasmid pRiA4b ORF-3 family protein [Iamia sp. SCSIO 61187]|uniref:plasmid pRiA4b ORF-3 family protein n=1 Tax=Iamia sp. SCSIO 61187 TaxID=2722752 RepID=UPI001C6353EC|nr:plasmid pRiA4b ORF-3 family protein [Iamia sp. SCSIO 61187]QYG92364.1 plasmid pRiA4b ORF-3 family protein [Iamia sp. SCSIO 61187]
MSKKRRRKARGGRVTPKGTRPGSARQPRSAARSEPREPSLLDEVAGALATGEPVALLGLASTFVELLTRKPSPFEAPPPDLPPLAEVVRSFVEVPGPESTALLAALAPMVPDELVARAARRELAHRDDALPAWLAGLDRAEAGPVLEIGDVLGDASNVMVEVRVADGQVMTVVAHLDHSGGAAVADAFVLPDRIDAVLASTGSATDPHLFRAELDPADARARVEDAIRLGDMIVPPYETETWPASKPLLRWAVGLLPAGGEVPERHEWSDEEEDALIERLFASDEGRPLDDEDHRDLMGMFLWLGTGYWSGDPLRWSPDRAAHLLLDLVPRKLMAPADQLAKVPDLLRALVTFGHRERGIPAELTAETLAVIDEVVPEFLDLIADEDRPRGAEAIAARTLGLAGATSPLLREVWEDGLARVEARAGGPEALASLDTDPLPDEALDLSGVPDGALDRVHEVADLGDEACAALLGIEARTAFRRLLARVAREAPEVLLRGRADTAAAALCWAVARDSDLLGTARTKVTAKALLARLGIAGGSVSTRAGTLLRAAGLERDGSTDTGLPPELMVATARRTMRADAARYRSLLAEAGSLDDPGQAARTRAAAEGMQHRLKVTLEEIRPPVWRRLEVASTATLADLHEVLQVAFGWAGGHLHAFTVAGREHVPAAMLDEWEPLGAPSIDESTVTIAEVLPEPGATGAYAYDFGDGWEHRIEVEAIEPATDHAPLPRCTGGRRAGPPDDVGGPWGYERLLDALADPSHPDHDELRDWLGGPFDPEAFDADEVTRRLRARFPTR